MNYSIIVTAYNDEKTLPQCLEALNNQTLAPKVKIMIDDVSTDRTPDIGREYGFIVYTRAPPKLKEPYANRCRAFYTGITQMYAQNVYGEDDIVFKVDSDIVTPTYYAEKLLKAFDNPEVGLASGVSEAYANTRFVSNGAIMYRIKLVNYGPFIYGWDRKLALDIIKRGYLPYIDTGLKYRELKPPRVTHPPIWRVLRNRLEMRNAMKGRKTILAYNGSIRGN